MKLAELQQLTAKKLFGALREKRRELSVLRFRLRTGQAVERASVRTIRQTIARIMTLLSLPKT